MKKENLLKHINRLMLVVLLSSAFFIGLYIFNNRYTHQSVQPSNGLLVITENDYTETSLRFLCNNWSFYPGVLLTPETLQDNPSDQSVQYINIGEYTPLNSLNKDNSSYTSGTYVLRLLLPDETHTYALELPEIFSAYCLYIEDKLVLQLGNPDPDAFYSQTQLRMVSFDAAGSATVILAVSDNSYFGSGLSCPPAFGTPLALNLCRGIRLGVSVIGCTLLVVVSLLSLYMGFKTYNKNTFILALLCFTMLCYASYPLQHALLALPVFPWYGLEVTCSSLISLFVLILHNRICDVKHTPARVSTILTAFICVLSLICGLSESNHAHLIAIYYALHFIYKAAACIYYPVTAFLSVKGHNNDAAPMLYASAAYIASFIWSCIFPSFEPIVGGCFFEWGSIFLVVAVVYTLWRDIAQSYTFSLALAEEHRQLTRQIAIQQSHYLELTEKIEDSIKWRHDERHHLKMICSFLENGELDKMRDYLMDYKLSYDNTERTVLCKNLPLDAILQYYKCLCRQAQINFTVNAIVPPNIHVSDTDLSILCGNLIENAYEACMVQTVPDPYIDIKAGYRNGRLLLRIENSYDVPVQIRKGKYLSVKHAGYGIGTASAEALIKKYNGQLKFDVTDSVFKVSAILSEKRHD